MGTKSRGRTRSLALGVALVTLAGTPSSSAGQEVGLGAQTTVHFSHHLHRDGNITPIRMLRQRVGMEAFAREACCLPTRVDVQFRYVNDFALPLSLRSHRATRYRFSHPSLDVAQVQWSPGARTRLILGRQWIPDGRRRVGLDGIRALVSNELSGGGVFELHAEAGRALRGRFDAFEPEWIAQEGMVSETDASTGVEDVVWGFGGTWSWQDEVEFRADYRRRQDVVVDGADDVADERVGIALRGEIASSLEVLTSVRYHLLAEEIDALRLRLDATHGALRGWVELDERRARFDSATIWNVFGSHPYQQLEAGMSVPIAAAAATLRLRAWSRLYRGRDELLVWRQEGDDERWWGAALHHRISWSMGHQLGSLESHVGGTQQVDAMAEHFFAGSRLRLPVFANLAGDARLSWLHAVPSHHRHNDSHAFLLQLGISTPTGLGTFGLSAGLDRSDAFPMTTTLLGTFEGWKWL